MIAGVVELELSRKFLLEASAVFATAARCCTANEREKVSSIDAWSPFVAPDSPDHALAALPEAIGEKTVPANTPNAPMLSLVAPAAVPLDS